MAGFDPNFLGPNIRLPLPKVSPARTGDVLVSAQLDSSTLAMYPNYAVITDKRHRAPLYVVALLDNTARKKTNRSDNWRIDQRIGRDGQLDDAYFVHNDYDRGHMAMREAQGWGTSVMQAQTAADETFYFSNACLQHANVNQDEWLALEKWTMELDSADGKVVVFSGPIFDGVLNLTISPIGREPARIPSGFFKIVCFVDKATMELGVRAFYMLQDDLTTKDKAGRKTFPFQKYQVTVKEIERLTGLEFADDVYEKNPLFFSSSVKADAVGVVSFPERIDINRATDIIRGELAPRIQVEDDAIEVYIAAAQPGVAGRGWVSILNLEPTPIDLVGWTLEDNDGNKDHLSGKLRPGESKAFSTGKQLSRIRIEPDSGLLSLFNSEGHRVDRVDYTVQDVAKAAATGRQLPIIFSTYRL